MNKTIQLLMWSDIFMLTGFGLVDPILAIYIKDNLEGGTVFSAAVCSTLFLLVKSLVQLPFSKYIDKHKADHDLKWLIAGSLLITLVPFFYIFSYSVFHIYIAQIIHGVGSGLAYSAWLGIWSVSLDKNKESFEWSLYSTLVGLGTALTAIIGGYLSEFIGFKLTFAFVGILSLVGCGILFFLLENKKKQLEKIVVDTT